MFAKTFADSPRSWQKFRESNIFSKKNYLRIDLTKYFLVRLNFSFFHTVSTGETRNLLSPEKDSSNQLFIDLFIENVAFTKYLSKQCESKIV